VNAARYVDAGVADRCTPAWLYGSGGIVGHMKTTVNLPEELLREAQQVARQEGTTLRSLIETGLREALKQRRSPARFELTDASVDGSGLQPEFRGASWDTLRNTIYDTPA
jgi:hypothetical protein